MRTLAIALSLLLAVAGTNSIAQEQKLSQDEQQYVEWARGI